MIRSEINQLIIDKVKGTDYPQHIKDFVLEILHYESSHYEEIEAGGVPRYSKDYENLLNKHIREQLESSAQREEG
jgi:hypothetical protein